MGGVSTVLHDADGDHPCEAMDLNRLGIMLLGDFSPPVDPEVRLTLESTAGDLVVHARGRVAHSQKDEEGHTQLGLEFLEFEESEKKTLEALISRTIEGRAPAALARLGNDAAPEDVEKALSTIPLPHRIQAAIRAFSREREIFFQDDSPQVLEALARNPNITMPEIVSLVRKMKILPSTLDVIAKDPRWAGNEELKILVATHPRVTLPTAQRLVNQLSDLGLRKVIRKPGLHPALRQKILDTVTTKRLKGW